MTHCERQVDFELMVLIYLLLFLRQVSGSQARTIQYYIIFEIKLARLSIVLSIHGMIIKIFKLKKKTL